MSVYGSRKFSEIYKSSAFLYYLFQRQIIHSNEEFQTNEKVLEVAVAKKVSESDDNDPGLKSVFVENEKTEKILSKANQELKKLQIEERKAPRLKERIN